MVRKKRFLNLSQPHSLSKPGVRQTKPPSLIDMNRPPTNNDYDGFQNGDEWIDRSSKVGVVPPAHDVYKLVDKTKQIATWVKLGAGSAELLTLTGDAGGGISSTANNINTLGGVNMNTVGTPGTSTVTFNVTADNSFFAYAAAPVAAVTGDGTAAVVVFNTELYDNGNNFAGGTTYTAPVTGLYEFVTFIRSERNGATARTPTTVSIVTTALSYISQNPSRATITDHLTVPVSTIAPMTIGDTAHVTFQVSVFGVKDYGYYGEANPTTYFYGRQIA